MPASVIASVLLTCTEEGSAKAYRVQLEETGSGFAVNGFNGRIGSALKLQPKGVFPALAAARAAFDALVAAKVKKHYRVSQGAPGGAVIASVPTDTGLRPQLLIPIERSEAERLLDDARYLMQQKHDGERLMVRRDGGSVVGANKLGNAASLPQALVADILALPEDSFIVDGELVGDTYHVFDLLEAGGHGNERPFAARHEALIALLRDVPSPWIAVVGVSHANKREALNALYDAGAEGVVFKRADAPVEAGRKHGTQFKFKFYETATCRVSRHNAKQSVGLEMRGNAGWVEVGNVTIPPNAAKPAIGTFVEVRYLYAYAGGSLYQPTFLRVRGDVADGDCDAAQLKLKRESATA
ncbi:WGR domain-containing protein [bacterium]|nr:MAG: WGR domain-containing protein [bacterium]